jgi:hypothetical protein
MDPFEFLIQLFAILAGLGIAALVQGTSRLVEERHRVRFHWPFVAWIACLFVAHIASWFALWGLRVHAEWTLAQALCLLAIPTLLYFSSNVVLPAFDGDGQVDLESHYFRTIRYSQTGLVLALAAGIIVSWTLTGEASSRSNAFRFGAAVLMLPGLFWLHPRLHQVQGVVVVGLLALLVSTMAGTIG